MSLHVDTYRRNELAAARRLGPRTIQAFTPVTFQHIAYPSEVSHEDEIYRYVDTMHEDAGMPASVFAGDFLVTADEVALINSVADTAEEVTRTQLGRAVRPWVAPFYALVTFRMIHDFASKIGGRITVYEIGGGSGYLGALLIKAGYRYISMDIASGFYLWQNRLFEALAPGEFAEMGELEDFSSVSDPGTRVVHVPWWIHGAFHQTGCPFTAGLVVADHALGEMSSVGLKYNIRLARDLLRGRAPTLFMTSGLGMEHVSAISNVVEAFYDRGFRPVIVDTPLAFAPVGSTLFSLGLAREDLSREISAPGSRRAVDNPLLYIGDTTHRYAPSGDQRLVQARDVFPRDWDKAPIDYAFMKYIGEPGL